MNKLTTPHGVIQFPAFFPVTTFGDKYPLDHLIQPYLRRLSQCLMVSYHYAQQMKKRPSIPIFVDSGGFASLFEGSKISENKKYASIITKDGEEISPNKLLQFQLEHADIGATLDFIIPPNIDKKEATHLQTLTIKNALYTKKHFTGNLFLYASLQCWDETSAAYSAKLYKKAGFQGIAIGGMVPRAQDPDYILSIVKTVHREAPNCAIHVFGCGNTKLIPELIKAGANSTDSSSYVRNVISAKTSEKRGIHTDLYKALENLSKINETITSTPIPKQTITSNLKLISNSAQHQNSL